MALTSSLGLRPQTPLDVGSFGACLRGSLPWEHAFSDRQLQRDLAFVDGGQSFKVRGVELDRDSAVLGVGALVNLSPRSAVSLDYEGRFASVLSGHSASLKTQWAF